MFGKKIKIQNISGVILGLFSLLLLNPGCQRDDICPESTLTTPLLKISFFDIEDQTIPKPPINLSVKAEGIEGNLLTRVNASEISIPLRTDVDFTTYEFILNDPAANDSISAEGNKDVLAFSYAREQVYINRACSFKITYLNLAADREQEAPATNNWILDISVDQPTIDDEKTTNISIFH
jgi:hypothetical protein